MSERPAQRAIVRYGVPVLASIAAAGVTLLMPELLAPIRLFFFWCAVAGSGLLGVRSAVVAAVASVALIAIVILPPAGSLAVGREDGMRLLLFLFFAGAIGVSVGFVRKAQQQAESLAREKEAVVERLQRRELTSQFINRATGVLSASLNYEKTLKDLAELCVPELADACTIDIARDGGYEQVLKIGRSELTSVPDEHSSITIPMTVRGRTLGVLTLIAAESRRKYSDEELALVEELGRRAALALDNARLYDDAEKANRAKDEFLATLSHELRTPLTTILGWANMLQGGMLDRETTTLAIDTIARSARTQGNLIEELLNLSRIVAGKLDLTIEPIEMIGAINHVLDSARPAADAKRIKLTFEHPEQPVFVRGDLRRLSQIVWNLVGNAIKFTPPGGRVTVTLRQSTHMAMVKVADNGRGIDKSFLPHIWERFRQADSSSSRHYGGLGLGLAVVRYLVEAHGGTVAAESPGEGQGATLTVELPLIDGSFDAVEPAIEKAPSRSLEGKRLLVVEDDADSRAVIEVMLQQFGADVTVAASAKEALQRLGSTKFDAMITDIAMASGDGFSLLADVRRLDGNGKLPVIALSAMSGTEMRERTSEAGFNEFVEKPVAPAALADVVARAMR